MTDSPLPRAPLRNLGERFRCRVDVEDITIGVEGDVAVSTTDLFWEEMRAACSFNGVTQRTRWMTIPIAIEGAKKELQRTGASGGGLLSLTYSPFNNLSYEVEFTAEGVAQVGSTPGDPSGASSVRTVKSKRFHLMEFVVELQNKHRLYSLSGGQTGDRMPTSGNMEIISATLNKGAARVSAWTRSVFSKIGNTLDSPQSSKLPRDVASPRVPSHTGTSTSTPPETSAGEDFSVREGVYVPVVKEIDASHAYNSPGGRQRFSFVLKPESRGAPASGTGTPMTLTFTLVAHFREVKSVPRYFHNFAIVADQFVLDFSEAATELPPGPKGVPEQRRIVGYSFGYTANTSSNSDELVASSQTVPVAAALPFNASDSETVVRVIDFDRLHTTGDEAKRTAKDYNMLPTSCCIVSGSAGSLPANRQRIGNRIVCVSRFKTSPDGLCKPSFKCQLVVSLMRHYGSSGEYTRETGSPIDLAALLNQEVAQQSVRVVKFSLGEVMYLRLRRFSFAEPELLLAPLLMPYDYCDTASDPVPSLPPTDSRTEVHSQSEQRLDGPLGNRARVPCADDDTIKPGSQHVDSASSSPASNSAPPYPQDQRSDSESPLEVKQVLENPFFSLEPEGTLPIELDSSEAGGQAHVPAQPLYTMMPTASDTCRSGGCDSDRDAPPAFEIIMTEPNPLFSLEPQSTSGAGTSEPNTDAFFGASVGRTPYDFGNPEAPDDEDGATNPVTPAFELTPL